MECEDELEHRLCIPAVDSESPKENTFDAWTQAALPAVLHIFVHIVATHRFAISGLLSSMRSTSRPVAYSLLKPSFISVHDPCTILCTSLPASSHSTLHDEPAWPTLQQPQSLYMMIGHPQAIHEPIICSQNKPSCSNQLKQWE